jgi:hypothetical protein
MEIMDLACARCGGPFAIYGNWMASDELWQRVSGMGKQGFLCIQCFDAMADELDLELVWVPIVRSPEEERQPFPWKISSGTSS